MSGKKAHLNSQSSLSGAMVSPFRYDEGVTIYTNGERVAQGLLEMEKMLLKGAFHKKMQSYITVNANIYQYRQMLQSLVPSRNTHVRSDLVG